LRLERSVVTFTLLNNSSASMRLATVYERQILAVLTSSTNKTLVFDNCNILEMLFSTNYTQRESVYRSKILRFRPKKILTFGTVVLWE